jgi:hypothetical protein
LTSAMPLIAARKRTSRDFRVVPRAEVAALFDHLVGALLKLQGHVEAKRLSGL